MEGNEKLNRNRKKIVIDNFLGGIAWSIGVWIGTTIIVGIFVFIIAKIDFIPVVGNFVAEIAKYVAKTSTQFRF